MFSYFSEFFFYLSLSMLSIFFFFFRSCNYGYVGLLCLPYLSFSLQSLLTVDFSISFCAMISSQHTISVFLSLFSSIFPCTINLPTLRTYISSGLVFLDQCCSQQALQGTCSLDCNQVLAFHSSSVPQLSLCEVFPEQKTRSQATETDYQDTNALFSYPSILDLTISNVCC